MSSAVLPIPCIEGNRGPVNIGLGATFLIFTVTLTCMRIFTRTRRVTGGLGWDDGFIILAVVLAFPLYAFTVKHVEYGLGRHIGCLSSTEIIKADMLQAIGEVPVIMSTLFSRVSICFFLLRLFAINTHWRWTLYLIIALTTATNIACGTAILLQCHPRARMWNRALPGTCWLPVIGVAIGQIQGAISVFLDLILSGLPIYCMWKIQLSRRIKAVICGIMSLGVFTACCALVRTVVLGRISSEDITWDSALPSLMGDLEVYVAIIAANIATLRPLFTHKSQNPTINVKYPTDGNTRLKYMKFPANSESFGASATSYDTRTTAGRVMDEDVSLEDMGGIRRVTDIHVSV